MSSLRLNKNIKKEIINKGENLFTARIAKKRDSLRPDFYDDVAQAFVDKFMKPYLRNRNFPDTYYRYCTNLDAHFSTGWVLAKPLNKTYKVLALNQFGIGAKLDLNEKSIDPTLHKEYKQYYERIALLQKERDDFTKELRSVLDNCNTVTQFLKIWPQGGELIADLNLETTTRTRKKKEITVDQSTLETLNVALLKQTMLNN
jgi:hypothetical protein